MEGGSSSRFMNFERGESSRSNANDENRAEDYEMSIAEEDESDLEIGSTRDENGEDVFSNEQVEIMEKVFAIFGHPSVGFLKEMMQDHLILSNLQLEDIKIWFRERRARENRQRESIFLQMAHERLTATFVVLGEHIQNNVKGPPPMFYHDFIRYALGNVPAGINDISDYCEHIIPQLRFGDENDPEGILFLAQQIKADFLSKATRDVVDWCHIPVTKLGPGAVRKIDYARYCSGVAARAYDIVPLKPKSVVEILKHRSSWSSNCRKQIICVTVPAGTEGKIELMYTQLYTPVTEIRARDFWTIRYTSREGYGFVVCERSVPGSCTQSGPSLFFGSLFTTAEMLTSGFLVQPCAGVGSYVHIVDHLDLQAIDIDVEMQPVFKSSKLVAEKMTVAALDYIKDSVGLKSREGEIRSCSRRLSRAFNDAIDTFGDAGWRVLQDGGSTDLTLSVNSTKKFWTVSDSTIAHPSAGGILCVKGFVILNRVSSAYLVSYLREHRFQWADAAIEAYCAATLHCASNEMVDLNSYKFYSRKVQLGKTVDGNEVLDMIQLRGQSLFENDASRFQDVCYLQICNGIEENDAVACSELLFAPQLASHCGMLSDDAPLLASGFRVFPLESKTWHGSEPFSIGEITDQALTTDVNGGSCGWNISQVLVVVGFQFPFGRRSLEDVETVGSAYVKRIFSHLQRISLEMKPLQLIPSVGHKLTFDSQGAATLARWISKSYSLCLYDELLKPGRGSIDTVFKRFWYHPQAILCCSFKPIPVCLLANQAAVDMLETNLENVQDVSVFQIFKASRLDKISAMIERITTEHGYDLLPRGSCETLKGNHVSYDQAITWKVIGDDGTIEGFAIEFNQWSC